MLRRHIDGLPWLTFAFFSPEKGAESGGGSGGGADSDDDNDDNDDKDDKSDKKDGEGDSDDSSDEDDKPRYSTKDMTRIVSERINKDREKRKAEADKQALKEKEDFKKLYETTEAELKSYKDKAELADQLIESNNAAIDLRIKDWPEEIKDMDPGKENIKARIAWVEKAAKAVKKIEEAKVAPIDGEHGDKGKGKEKLDSVIGNITKPEKYAIPGQKK